MAKSNESGLGEKSEPPASSLPHEQVSSIDGDVFFPLPTYIKRPRLNMVDDEMRRCAREIYHCAFDLLKPDFAAYIHSAADTMGAVFDEAVRMAIALIEAGFGEREIDRLKFRIPGDPAAASVLLRAMLARRRFADLAARADDATAAAERAAAAIDEVLDFVAQSNARINELEKAKKRERDGIE